MINNFYRHSLILFLLIFSFGQGVPAAPVGIPAGGLAVETPELLPPDGVDERVGDAALPLDIGDSTVTVHQSLTNEGNWYIAPVFTFLPVHADDPRIATASMGPTGQYSINAALQLVAPMVREAIAGQLRDLGCRVEKVGNLPLTRVEVVFGSSDLQAVLGADKVQFERPPHGQRQDLTIYLKTTSEDLVNKTIEQINRGDIEFIVTYYFDEIQIDKTVTKIRAEHVRSCRTYLKLRQSGKYLMTVDQAQAFADDIGRELSVTQIRSLGGKIEQNSLDVSALLKTLKVEDLAARGDEVTRSLDRRLYEENKIRSVNLDDFRPIEIQKKVSSILNSGESTSDKRKQLLKEASENSRSWSASAGFSFFGLGASGGYANGVKDTLSNETATETELADFASRYFAVQYDDKLQKYRGVEIYDLAHLDVADNTELASVIVQPTLTKGYRSLKSRPSAVRNHGQSPQVSRAPGAVPIGGIVAWYGNWGIEESRPYGFEVCDGNPVETPGGRAYWKKT